MSFQEPMKKPARRSVTRISAGLLVGAALALGAFAVGARSGGTDLVPAAVPPAEPGLFIGIAPERVLDTRDTDGGPIGIDPAAPIGEGEELDVQIAGEGSVPAGATGVTVNITIDSDATSTSFLSVWPTGENILPDTASINNAEPGLITQNTAVLKLGTDGQITIYNSLGEVNVIIDVTGYFVPGVVAPTTSTSSTTSSSTTLTTTSG